ncbi:hypothetical protein [Geotalea toluenoxydans]|uniref:hypothetical protein n=1 Tax=Geotalea toluenoxydans TaxID=421624 RepID=UPI0006D1C254|nr:hypothetical protein [Geotalea toluenoxydans]
MKNICCLLIFLFLSVCLAACDHGSRNQQKVGFVRDSVKLADVPKDCAVGDASFSPLGQGVVITVAKDNKQTIYAGSESGAFYDSIRDLLFSESGTSYAYIAVNNGKEHVVVNKEEGTAYDSIGKIIFAPGGRIVYEAMASGKWQVVSDKKVSESFDGIMSRRL